MRRKGSVGPRVALGIALGAAVAAGGCDALDQLLEVEAPSRVIASDMDEPGAAGLLVASAGNEFRCAFSHYAAVSGLVGWELRSSSNGGTQVFYDGRTWTTGGYGSGSYAGADCAGGGLGLYLPLSRARWFGDEVLRKLDAWGEAQVPEKTEFEARVAAWAGYSYLLLGESMCSVAFDGGPEQTTADAFELAIDRFEEALTAAQASGQDDFANLARVGMGRALLNLGRAADAATAVADVPDGFTFELQYSALDNATHNRVFRANRRDENVSIGEMYIGTMVVGGVPDPRVPVTDEGRTVAGYSVPLFTTSKYASLEAPMRLASWEEARLIEAEAAVEADDLATAVSIINAIRAEQGGGLPTDFASTDADEVMAEIIYERRAEFFLESHHLMDMKRYGLAHYPAAGESFPFGGLYSDQTCFELPDTERFNNPNLS